MQNNHFLMDDCAHSTRMHAMHCVCGFRLALPTIRHKKKRKENAEGVVYGGHAGVGVTSLVTFACN
jgi:hypothetical protein